MKQKSKDNFCFKNQCFSLVFFFLNKMLKGLKKRSIILVVHSLTHLNVWTPDQGNKKTQNTLLAYSVSRSKEYLDYQLSRQMLSPFLLGVLQWDPGSWVLSKHLLLSRILSLWNLFRRGTQRVGNCGLCVDILLHSRGDSIFTATNRQALS